MIPAEMGELYLGDIQGFILRGYTMPRLRCFAVRINHAGGARCFLAKLVGGSEGGEMPQITTGAPWAVKPGYCLNLGLTYEGLKALEVQPESLESFPEEFRQGAVQRASHIGDTGASAPEHWKGHFASPDVHLLLWLFAQSTDAMENRSALLRSEFTADGGLTDLSHHDAAALPEHQVHFGYRDSISQPNITGGPWAGLDDPLPRAPAGEFLLGYPSQFRDFQYPVPTPPTLGLNGSFVAFRMLRQDVHGFETFLQENAPKVGMSPERLAAKICGRWRNGVPLALSPDTDTPSPPILQDKLNYFDYAPTEASPDSYNDTRGLRCPIGSHLRRANPRSARIAGNGGHLHRLVRRGLPYGAAYDPAHPNDGIERGLMGVFIAVSLRDQFEFVMREWINSGIFAPGLGQTRDPLAGDNHPDDSKFVIPTENGTVTVRGFSQFVTTRAGAYCFLPSITAMRHLSH